MGCPLKIRRKHLRSVMDRKDVNLVHPYDPIDDTVRSVNDLTNERVIEFRNCPT